MSLPDSIWESSKQPFIKAKEEFIFEWEIYEKKIEKWKEKKKKGSINSRKALGIFLK